MLPDMEKLYAPYARDADLQTSLLYWQKEASKLGVSAELRDQAIAETFLEMANGKVFPVGKCDCGCEFPVEWSCVALNHYVLKKMVAVKNEIAAAQAEMLKRRLQTTMLELIEKDNAAYTAENMPNKSRWVDWDKSETVNAYRRLKGKWTGSHSPA